MEKQLSYTSEGKGKALVFIHGFCESKEIWQYFKPYFVTDYQVICLDLPGHGDSEALKEGASIEQMAKSVYATLQSLGIAKPILIGHSLGGYVALAYTALYPEKIAGICLFHSSAYSDAPEKKENRNKTIEYVRKHGVDNFANPFVPGLFFHKRREELQHKIQFALEIARKMKVEDIAIATAAMRDRPDRTNVLETTKVPVAFIAGKGDTAVTLDKSIAQSSLPNQSHILFLGETGHMGMFEREKECAQFLLGFVAGI